jgi:glycosyltransferase involved in cell wall biosynthesis
MATIGTAGSTDADLPSVTVTVPTYNRAAMLAGTLDRLMAQDYPPDRMEIIVVDNSSADNTEEVVHAARARSPFPLRYFRKENRGPAASRNYAVARAAGEILAFTDSDCRMAPDWVRAGVRRMGPGVGLVAGPVRPVSDPERPPGFFHHQIDFSTPNTRYPTANVFYRRDVFDQMGGFDERFGALPWGPPVGGEDTDLAWRVKRAGYRAEFAEEAPVEHEASRLSPAEWLVHPIRAQIVPHLMDRIPELREELWLGCFAARSTAAFHLGWVGAVLALVTRRPFLLALLLPWVWSQRSIVERRDLWPPPRWIRIPVKYALMVERFGMYAATLIVASIRYHRVVL